MMLPDKPPPFDPDDYVSAPFGGNLTPGETIRALRNIGELTQCELAEQTGIAQNAISAIENGRATLGMERAKLFARAFGVHPGVILFSDWKPEAA